MSNNLQNTTTPAGPKGILGVLAILLVFVLSIFLYVYASWFIPFIILKVFLVVGFGVLIGMVIFRIGVLARLGTGRARTLAGVLVAFAAYYLHWVLYCTLMTMHLTNPQATEGGFWAELVYSFKGLDLETFWYYLSSPSDLIQLIFNLNEVGTISFEAIDFKGGLLWGVWLIEAALIIGVALTYKGLPGEKT